MLHINKYSIVHIYVESLKELISNRYSEGQRRREKEAISGKVAKPEEKEVEEEVVDMNVMMPAGLSREREMLEMVSALTHVVSGQTHPLHYPPSSSSSSSTIYNYSVGSSSGGAQKRWHDEGMVKVEETVVVASSGNQFGGSTTSLGFPSPING